MASYQVRISMSPPPRWSRWVDRLRGRHPRLLEPVTPANVDLSLVSHVAAGHVRAFVESIDTYQLVTRRVVQVLSHFEMPDHDGLTAKMPVWLSERIRFGVVDANGRDFHYAVIRAMEMRWNDDGTELRLHLDKGIAPGTRAFIAAYLGDSHDTHALRELPFSSLPLQK